ncbi:hypothetical protein ACHWQZ_G011574 [Mnemiopsis leidyi]
MRSTRDKLIMSLTELQGLVMVLIQSVHSQATSNPQPGQASTEAITTQIIEKQNIINEIIQEAEEQEEIQRQIAVEKQEYHRLESEVNKLQQQLRQSQQVLEMVVASANEKTEQTQAVKEKQCTVRDLLSYAHLISSSYSNQMPANWTELDYRRPWPTDLDMRAGELGKLSAGILPVLNEGVLAERQALQAKPWQQQQPLTQVSQLESQEKAELLPVKEEMSSSSDEDGDHMMEEVT